MRCSKGRNNYGEFSHKEWLKFSMIPLLTVASMLLMFFCKSAEAKVQTAYLFLSVGLIFINIFVIELMQGILEKEELLRESALAGQKKESQLAHYRDMQAVYERQGRMPSSTSSWCRRGEADLLCKEPRGGKSMGHGRHRPVEREGSGG